MSNEFLEALESASFDVLLIDLIDERFPILQKSNGALHTLSNEYAAVRTESAEDLVLPTTSAEKFALWKEGWIRVYEALLRQGEQKKLVINRVYWATKDTDGKPLEGTKPDLVEIANSQLDLMYDTIAKTAPDVHFITYPREDFQSDKDHKWGVAPFHYQSKIYRRTVKYIDKIAERNHQVGDLE